MITKDLGMVTAYAYAVAGGYTGTEEEFKQLMADLADEVERLEDLSVTVTTLPEGSPATASLSGSVLSLGIPKGDTGATGPRGETGATPHFTIGTVETTTEPEVTITGTDEDPVLNFGLVKGDKGDPGDVSLEELEDYTVVQTDEDKAPYNFRVLPECGHVERLKKIIGASIAFNQLYDKNKSVQKGSGTGTVSIDPSTGTVTIEATGTTSFQWYSASTHPFQRHKALIVNRVTASENCGYGNRVELTGAQISLTANTPTEAAGIIYVPNYGGTAALGGTVFGITNVPMTVTVENINVVDLTLALGSTIADYAYSLEQATTGAGVAWLRDHFPKMFAQYNTFDAGSIRNVEGVSEHRTVGKNQLDVNATDTTKGYIAGSYLNNVGDAIVPSSGIAWNTSEYIKVEPSTDYVLSTLATASSGTPSIVEYDENFNYVRGTPYSNTATIHILTSRRTRYVRISIMELIASQIQFELGSIPTDYEPYNGHSYPLDSDLVLRGVPKLDNGELYYDGDQYNADGSVVRRCGVVDLGSLTYTYNESSLIGVPCFYATIPNIKVGSSNNVSSYFENKPERTDINGNRQMAIGNTTTANYIVFREDAYTDPAAFKTAMSGVMLVYELSTPATESADPFTEVQNIEPGGTEEFVSTSIVPVGQESEFPMTLIDTMPTAAGNYTMKLNIANGKRTVSWINA